jgi:hypothetical protein
MLNQVFRYPASAGVQIYANYAALPVAPEGTLATVSSPLGLAYIVSGGIWVAVGSGGGGGSSYPQVNTFADLPAASTVAGQIYVVLTATGSWLTLNRKQSGFYLSNGTTWTKLDTLSSSDIADLYELNPDTNKYTDDDKAGLTRLLSNEDIMATYKTNNLDEVSNVTYIGKAKPGTNLWLIVKLTATGADYDLTYANVSNNVSYTTYSAAWTDRLTLTYNQASAITGL